MVVSVLNNDKLGSDSINTDTTDLLPAPVNLELQDEFHPVTKDERNQPSVKSKPWSNMITRARARLSRKN